MKKITDYTVERSGTFENLGFYVMLVVARGYTPIGGVTSCKDGWFYQAMVKYKEVKEND